MNLTHLIFLAAILVGILIITHWAAKTNTTPQQFYIVSGNLTATQNGLAIAGDFISVASFLGITGSIAFYGFDAVATESMHWIAYPGLAAAVREYLGRERRAVADEIEWFGSRTALRRQRGGPDA